MQGSIRASVAFLYFLLAGPVDGAMYYLEEVSTAGAMDDVERSVPGLHVGSMLAFKSTCINVDISGIEDARGAKTEAGVLFALVADESPSALAESPLSDADARRLYFLQHDGTQRFPFRDGRFEWIIAEHFIEHISFPEAVTFLAEARRLLAPGGTLRLSTPDLAIYAAAFFDPSQRFFKEHYAVMTQGPGMEGNKGWLSDRRADMFNQIFYGYGHKHIYDEGELRAAATAAGWFRDGCDMRVGGFKEGVNAALAGLDDAVHRDESIYVDLYCGESIIVDPHQWG